MIELRRDLRSTAQYATVSSTFIAMAVAALIRPSFDLTAAAGWYQKQRPRYGCEK
jgi:hypothetical protein